ncbi:MAG: HD domain-containing protein [Caldilineaceae bacterium]
MLTTDRAAAAILALHDVGLLIHVLPEVAHMDGVAQSYPHFEDVLRHTLRVIQNIVQLRNWLSGRSAVQANGSKAEQEIVDNTALSGQAMQRWIEIMAPHKVALHHHFAEPLATGRTRAEWLVWHALLHDIGKPETRTEEPQPNGTTRYRFFEHEQVGANLVEQRLTALRFSRLEVALAQRVTAFHMRPHLLNSSFLGQPLSRRPQYRFFRDTLGTQSGGQRDGIDVLCLAIADYQAIHHHEEQQNREQHNDYLHHVQELFDYVFDQRGFQATQQQPLVDGNLLMKVLGLAPGRQIGQILDTIQEAQAAGEVESVESALAYAADWLEKNAATKTRHE